MTTFAPELDREIAAQAETLAAHLRTSDYAPEHLRNSKARYEEARQTFKKTIRDGAWEKIYTGLCVALGVLALPAFAALLMGFATEWQRGLMGALPLLVFAVLTVAATVVGRRAECLRVKASQTDAALALVLPLLSHAGALERDYAQTVGAVLACETLPPDTRRELLRHLNTLIQEGRQLRGELNKVAAAMGDCSLAFLEAEYADLEARCQAAEGETRDVLEESLRLCKTNLGRARKMEPLRQLLNARQEKIAWAFASVRTSVAGMEVAANPRLWESTLWRRAGQQMDNSVVTLTAQTWAVEQAVREVCSMRVSA